MAAITPGFVLPVAAPFNTSPAYSGTFIPTIWSAKMNAKFYAASVFASICNKEWEGEIKNLGDKVIINNIPTLTISDYVVGGTLNYQSPLPSILELQVDRAKSFSFQVADVLAYQSQPNMMEVFSNDAAQQMRVAMDATCIYRTFNGAVVANQGINAGVKSGLFNLGSAAQPVALTAANVLQKVLEMASVLDEQNVPDDGRWLVIDPLTRTLLLTYNPALFAAGAACLVAAVLVMRIRRFTPAS